MFSPLRVDRSNRQTTFWRVRLRIEVSDQFGCKPNSRCRKIALRKRGFDDKADWFRLFPSWHPRNNGRERNNHFQLKEHCPAVRQNSIVKGEHPSQQSQSKPSSASVGMPIAVKKSATRMPESSI